MLRKLILILAAVALAALVGCESSSSLKVGWVETSSANQHTARYATFSGTESTGVAVEGGQSLTVDYDVTVEKGTLKLAILTPNDETIWEQTFSEGDTGQARVTAAENGRYHIDITGSDTGGSYDISWEIEG